MTSINLVHSLRFPLAIATAVAATTAALALDTAGSTPVRAELERANPCPANGNTRGTCTDYQANHIVALMCGGKDGPANLQWLAVERRKQKTRADVKACSAHPASWPSVEHGVGLNACGCHVNRKTGECHCHQVSRCGCACQSAACPAQPR